MQSVEHCQECCIFCISRQEENLHSFTNISIHTWCVYFYTQNHIFIWLFCTYFGLLFWIYHSVNIFHLYTWWNDWKQKKTIIHLAAWRKCANVVHLTWFSNYILYIPFVNVVSLQSACVYRQIIMNNKLETFHIIYFWYFIHDRYLRRNKFCNIREIPHIQKT